jgi:hypothetical protein
MLSKRATAGPVITISALAGPDWAVARAVSARVRHQNAMTHRANKAAQRVSHLTVPPAGIPPLGKVTATTLAVKKGCHWAARRKVRHRCHTGRDGAPLNSSTGAVLLNWTRVLTSWRGYTGTVEKMAGKLTGDPGKQARGQERQERQVIRSE